MEKYEDFDEELLDNEEELHSFDPYACVVNYIPKKDEISIAEVINRALKYDKEKKRKE